MNIFWKIFKKPNNKKTNNCEKSNNSSNVGCNDEAFEKCVICGAVTFVPTSLPIHHRINYVVGCGQLCEECGKQYIDN